MVRVVEVASLTKSIADSFRSLSCGDGIVWESIPVDVRQQLKIQEIEEEEHDYTPVKVSPFPKAKERK